MKDWGMLPDKTDHCHAHILLYNLFEGKHQAKETAVNAATILIKTAAKRIKL